MIDEQEKRRNTGFHDLFVLGYIRLANLTAKFPNITVAEVYQLHMASTHPDSFDFNKQQEPKHHAYLWYQLHSIAVVKTLCFYGQTGDPEQKYQFTSWKISRNNSRKQGQFFLEINETVWANALTSPMALTGQAVGWVSQPVKFNCHNISGIFERELIDHKVYYQVLFTKFWL